MSNEIPKIIERINGLIESGEKYTKDYDFLDFTSWKNKVEYTLDELGGEKYLSMFFENLKENEKKFQIELEKIGTMSEDSIKKAEALFQLQISNHKSEITKVLNLLSILKEHIKSIEQK
jgi:hypothetical protein